VMFMIHAPRGLSRGLVQLDSRGRGSYVLPLVAVHNIAYSAKCDTKLRG